MNILGTLFLSYVGKKHADSSADWWTGALSGAKILIGMIFNSFYELSFEFNI